MFTPLTVFAPGNVIGTGAANTIWQIWNCSSTTASTIVYPTNQAGTVWQIWNSPTSMQSTAGTIWLSWVTATNQTGAAVQYAPSTPQVMRTPTAEELRAAERARAAAVQRMEEQRKLRVEQEAARQAARERAMELLRSHLRPEQLETIDRNGWFVVEGGQSKKQYRIEVNRSAGNIFELQDDKEVANYCVHADSQIPLADHLLAQALSLRFDEEHIIKTANKRVWWHKAV